MREPDRYLINAEELAGKLRVNATSLRALLRHHDLCAGARQAQGTPNLPRSRDGDLASPRRANAPKALGNAEDIA
jgi:hypothetical protein